MPTLALACICPCCSYVLNLKAAHSSPDFLWQIRLLTEPFKWATVAFPFSDMVLTKRGRIELTQHPVERENVQGVRC